ncbi:SET domain [Trypanosoma melophagium]|uniref:SET domain n=1 Tax=Trypanosoma melophagium TaxID=715481 RepID=UPI00351A8259|nr:SET domain [Trypanosoma melophagium]
MPASVEVREMGEDYGVGTYALQSFRPGDVLLQELPVVFTQSLESTSCCCCGCGMMLVSLAEECKRLSSLVELTAVQSEEQELSSPMNPNNSNNNNVGIEKDDCSTITPYKNIITSSEALYDTLKEFAASALFSGVSMHEQQDTTIQHHEDTLGQNKIRFCTVECRERYLHKQGGKFLFLRTPANTDMEATREATRMTHDLQEPSATMIMQSAGNLTEKLMEFVWPSKRDILRTLEFLTQHYNARLRLIISLLSRCLFDTFTVFASDAHAVSLELVQSRFTDIVEQFILRYAEGAARSLTEEQRAFLRFSWKCVSRWLTLCYIEEEKENTIYIRNSSSAASPFGWISLQLYLRCFWLADANVHTFVVVSPLYTLLCQQIPTMHAIYNHKNNNNNNNKSGNCAAQRLHHQICVLRELFRVVDPSAAHATGVALYNLATKINHSCTPSVRFVPTHSGVRAVVVALRDIAVGEEVRTSYIDINAYNSVAERREYLRVHYGFVCDCPLCSQE